MSLTSSIGRLLTPNERLFVMLRYVDGLRLSEIGQVTGIHPVIAGLVLMSIRRRLRNSSFLADAPAKSTKAAQAELRPYDPAAPPVFWHGSD